MAVVVSVVVLMGVVLSVVVLSVVVLMDVVLSVVVIIGVVLKVVVLKVVRITVLVPSDDPDQAFQCIPSVGSVAFDGVEEVVDQAPQGSTLLLEVVFEAVAGCHCPHPW